MKKLFQEVQNYIKLTRKVSDQFNIEPCIDPTFYSKDHNGRCVMWALSRNSATRRSV